MNRLKACLAASAVCGVLWLVVGLAARAQSVEQRGVGGQGASQAAPGQPGAQGAVLPPFEPLPPQHQKYLDSILTYWEQSSASIKRYRCVFHRYEYDNVFGPQDTYKTYSEGVIKFASPDRGLFKVEKILQYTPPPQAGGQPDYVAAEESRREYWVCDGQSIFEFNYLKQQLIERSLPAELRGKSITEGPLPFLFGAEAAKIKNRFWIRVITPRDAKGEYWLEAFPKWREDAANYSKVHVIIDEKDFLPKALKLFDPSSSDNRNPSWTTYVFENREVNWNTIAERLFIFHREFFKPETPKGWTRVVEDFGPPAAAQAASAPPARRQ